MTFTGGVSFLGQSQTQISRLKALNTTLVDLQRQLTTQKKYDSMSGFGVDSLSVQKLRTDKAQVQTYLTNINTVSTRVQIMSGSMQQAADSGRELVDSIASQIRDGTVDMATVSTIARQQLDLMRDIANQEIDGRYLFAGSNTTTAPFASEGTLDMNTQSLIADWESGAITTAQMIASINGMSSTDLGFDPAMSTSGNVTAKIDNSLNIDYTSVATSNGFQQVMQALAIAANLSVPDPALSPPGPTQADFQQLLDEVVAIAKTGIDKVDAAHAQLGLKFDTLTDIQDKHEQDSALFDKLLIEKENVDTTEVVAQIQSLQTQLSASYEVTSLVSQLSLVNFI